MDGSGIAHPQYYIATTSSPADYLARVLKYGRMFFVFDRLGDVQTCGLGEEGLFYDGMRHLSALSLNLWNARPLLLSSTVATNNFLFTADLANLDVLSDGEMVIHRGTLHLVRTRFLWRDSCFEKLMFVNHGLENVEVPVRIGFDADFTDVFEVRGTVRERRGRRLEENIDRNSVILSYEGLDNVVRQTCIRSDANAVAASPSGLEFELALRPKERATIQLEICCSSEVTADSIGYTEALSSARFELAEMSRTFPQITSSNSRFSDWMARSISDLEMMIAGNPERNYPIRWSSLVQYCLWPRRNHYRPANLVAESEHCEGSAGVSCGDAGGCD